MARTALAPQTIVDEGITPAFTAANVDGHSIPGDGDHWLEIKNTNGAPVNVTILTGGTLMGEAVADKVVSIPATTGDKIIGPFPPALYNQADGLVYVDFASVTGVTAACFTK